MFLDAVADVSSPALSSRFLVASAVRSSISNFLSSSYLPTVRSAPTSSPPIVPNSGLPNFNLSALIGWSFCALASVKILNSSVAFFKATSAVLTCLSSNAV